MASIATTFMTMQKHQKVYQKLIGQAASRSARSRNWRDCRQLQGTREAQHRATLQQCLAFKIGSRVKTTLKASSCAQSCNNLADDGFWATADHLEQMYLTVDPKAADGQDYFKGPTTL